MVPIGADPDPAKRVNSLSGSDAYIVRDRGPASVLNHTQQQAHSKSMRFKSSISSDNVPSAVTRPVIFRTAWRTVVWSRPPNRRPISGSERGVKSLDRYTAIWRGAHHARGSPRRQNIAAAYIEMARDQLLDVLDVPAPG